MANNCNFIMKIKGKKENVKKFFKRMTDCDEPNHLNRVFSTDVCKECDNEDGTFSLIVRGICAWSLAVCGSSNGCKDGDDLFQINSEELDLEIEGYSNEYAMCFQEHYLYSKGDILDKEIVNWYQDIYNEGIDTGGFSEYGKFHI